MSLNQIILLCLMIRKKSSGKDGTVNPIKINCFLHRISHCNFLLCCNCFQNYRKCENIEEKKEEKFWLCVYLHQSKNQQSPRNIWDSIPNLKPKWEKCQFWMVFKMPFLKTLSLVLNLKKTFQLFNVNVIFEISSKVSYNKDIQHYFIFSLHYLIFTSPSAIRHWTIFKQFHWNFPAHDINHTNPE